MRGFRTLPRRGSEATLIRLDSVGAEVLFALPGQLVYAVNRGIVTDVMIAPDQGVLDTVIGTLAPAAGSADDEAAESPGGEAQASGDTGPDRADGE